MKKSIFTKPIVAIMILALLLPCFPVVATAEALTEASYTPDSSWYGDGSASEFTISTPEQLAYFMELGGLTSPPNFLNKTVKLGADIVWNDGVATASGFTPSTAQGNKIYKWEPYAQKQTGWLNFRGTFDGQGHTISGLYIDSTAGAVGFLGTTRGSTVKNLNLTNAYVHVNDGADSSATNDIGIAVGRTYGAITMSNVHVEGHLVIERSATFVQAGILIGGARHNTACVFTLSNCTASGSITASGKQHVGGLIGGVWAKVGTLTANMLTMTDCINYATVTGLTQVGGLVGNLASGATFTRCTSLGAVINTNGAAGSGSLVAIRLYNPGVNAFEKPSDDSNCAVVSFTDCFYASNQGNSHDFPIYVHYSNSTGSDSGHRIVTRYSDYGEVPGTTPYKEYVVRPGHENMSVDSVAKSGYELAASIRDEAFSAYTDVNGNAGSGKLQVPAKGTDVVKVEGVQTKKNDGSYAARFIASIDVADLSDVKGMGFEVAILNDYAVNGASAVKKQAAAKAYTSILSNYGMETVTAESFDGADYITTLVIDGIPASGIQTLLVRSYYTTAAGSVFYSGYVAFSFINGEFAGSTVVSTVPTDSEEVTEANAFVGYNTTTYDLAALLPDQVENLSISNDTQTFNGTSVPLSFGLNTFYANYTDNGNPRTKVICVSRRDQHRVVFNSNGGSYIPVMYVENGAVIDYKTVTPTRAGCNFTGWYTTAGTKVYLSSTPINQDMVLIAGWSAPTSSTLPQLDEKNQPPQLIYTTSSAALNINWKDYGNVFKARPKAVYCTLTDTDTSITYQVKVTETDAVFVNGGPAGAEISQGAGNWTVKITGLAAGSNYTLLQNNLGMVPYAAVQYGTTVINTFTKDYDPMKDETAALYTANGRLYDLAGNVVTLKGVVTVNVGTVNFAGNTSYASLARLKSEGVNCIRITMQLEGSNNIGYVRDTDGAAQTAERKSQLMELLMTAVNNATEMGMYCIVDWGILGVNPQDDQASAEEFFGALAATYKDNPYVIFEICNEPKVANGLWHSTVKVYSEDVIEVIRAAGSEAVVIVGTNDYSKRISDHTEVTDGRTDDPVDYPIMAYNVAYGYHAYAYNHEYTNTTSYVNGFGWRLKEAIEAGLTIVVTEFSPAISSIDAQSTGVTLASIFEANKYLNVFLENDVSYFLFRYISHFDSYETSSQHMFIKGNNAYLNAGTWTWDHLTEWGQWFVKYGLQSDGFIPVADYTPSTPR